MESTVNCLLLFLLVNHDLITAKPGKGTPLSDYILHYEPLHYDKDSFHAAHHRAKRSTKRDLHLDFQAHGRHFKLRLKRDHQIFSQDLVVENSDGQINVDPTRAYVGHLEGEEGSTTVTGVVTAEGLFEGKISTSDGDQYVIAGAKHHFTEPQLFHSVIYRHSDVHMPNLQDSQCKSDEVHKRIRTLQKEEGKKGSQRHNKHHYHTRLKSKSKGSSSQSDYDNNQHILKESNSVQHTMDNVAFQDSDESQSIELRHKDIHDKDSKAHIPDNVHIDMNRILHKVNGDNVVGNGMDGTIDVNMDVNNIEQNGVNQRHRHPAKYHKSAQNNHQHHHNHNPHLNQQEQKHHNNVATHKSNDEFQRLISDYEKLNVAAINTNPDLEEIDFETEIRTDDNVHINAESRNTHNSPKDSNDIRSVPRTEESPNAPYSSEEHNANDNVQTGTEERAQPHHRQKRAMIDPARVTCSLYLQADHLFFQKFHSNEETVIEQLTQHVQGVNEIYGAIDFDGDRVHDNIHFVIKRIKVHTDPNSPGYKFPGKYGVETYLELFSEDNFDAFCLAYMFTYRDFEGGTLGLAWTGDLQNAGGVCEKNGQFRGSLKSLNSGIVTILNYGKDVPPTVSHVTMAHEIGHNMGSQHDPETHECSPGGELGNYIMFARATSGDKPNNNKFSLCSQVSMALVMEAKARHTAGCFIAPTSSICGNEVVEPGEECDCGWDDECHDQCCHPQTSSTPTHHRPCTRTPGAICSPSEGPCCTSNCFLIGPYSNTTCREATKCKDAAFCNGRSPICPMSHLRADRTWCDEGYVCHRGECTSSICVAYGLESCQCDPDERSNFDHPDLCKLCCKQPGEHSICRPSHDWNGLLSLPTLMAKPGSPCNDYKGYCDVFHKCREVDPSGPLANLKRFFSGEGMASFKEWLATYWYVVLAAGLLLIVLMILFIKLCAPRKTKAPVSPVKHHEQITPVAHAPPLPSMYSTQCVASKPLLDNPSHYKHSTSSVAPTTPPIITRPSTPLLPAPTLQKLPPLRRPAPSPPCDNRKLLISGTNYPLGGKRLSQSEGWV